MLLRADPDRARQDRVDRLDLFQREASRVGCAPGILGGPLGVMPEHHEAEPHALEVARGRPPGVDGAIVFSRGDRSVDFLLAIEGAVEISDLDEAGEPHVFTTHRARQFTGEPDIGETITRAFILRGTGFIVHEEAGVALIGPAGSADALRMERFLRRNGYPVRALDPSREAEEAARLMDERGLTEADLPAVLAPDGAVLRRPANPELADALGLTEEIEEGHVHDVAVIGAGPAGLAAAVYAASEGLDTLIVETEAPGGQAGTSSKIENYLGFPTGISGQALAGRAWIQSQKFGARFAVSRAVAHLDCGEEPFGLRLDGGPVARARAVILATGATYRTLDVEGYERFENQGLHYAATALEADLCGGSEVAVVGGGNSAGQAAVFLSRVASHVHVLVRGEGLAASMSDYLVRRIEASARITLRTGTEITALHGERFLERVTWEGPDGETEHPVRNVFVMIGAVPNTAWLGGCVELDEKGFVRTGTDVEGARPASAFETSRAGVFAVGDVRSGSVKRVASGVGVGSVCVQAVHKYLEDRARMDPSA